MKNLTLDILKNSNPPLMWAELFGSKAFKHEEELHKALSITTSAGLVQLMVSYILYHT